MLLHRTACLFLYMTLVSHCYDFMISNFKHCIGVQLTVKGGGWLIGNKVSSKYFVYFFSHKK